MPCCKIRWIADGRPTPDENPAIGIARHTARHWDGSVEIRDFPVCAEHYKVMPIGSVGEGQRWDFLPLPEEKGD